LLSRRLALRSSHFARPELIRRLVTAGQTQEHNRSFSGCVQAVMDGICGYLFDMPSNAGLYRVLPSREIYSFDSVFIMGGELLAFSPTLPVEIDQLGIAAWNALSREPAISRTISKNGGT
jgi:hypothetical protein